MCWCADVLRNKISSEESNLYWKYNVIVSNQNRNISQQSKAFQGRILCFSCTLFTKITISKFIKLQSQGLCKLWHQHKLICLWKNQMKFVISKNWSIIAISRVNITMGLKNYSKSAKLTGFAQLRKKTLNFGSKRAKLNKKKAAKAFCRYCKMPWNSLQQFKGHIKSNRQKFENFSFLRNQYCMVCQREFQNHAVLRTDLLGEKHLRKAIKEMAEEEQ